MAYNILADLQELNLESTATCDNKCIILTTNNTVQIMGNIVLNGYEALGTVASLPESMTPIEEQIVTVYLLLTDTVMPVPMVIGTDGTLKIGIGVPSGTLYTSGIEFNVCNRYYNSEIGNNFPQGTSPLSVV